MPSIEVTNARLLAADTTAFRTWVSAANQAEALARAYVGGQPSWVRPFLLLATGVEVVAERWAGGDLDRHLEREQVYLLFEKEVGAGSAEVEYLTFLNEVGGILLGMAALAGTGTYLRVFAFELVGIHREDPNEATPYLQATFLLEWRP